MCRYLSYVLVALVMSLSVPAFALEPDCSPGEWFCEEPSAQDLDEEAESTSPSAESEESDPAAPAASPPSMEAVPQPRSCVKVIHKGRPPVVVVYCEDMV